MGALNGSLNGRITKLEDLLTPRSSWDAFWDETERRWFVELNRICELVPVDMQDEVMAHLKDRVPCEEGWLEKWLDSAGGLWRWHTSLVWTHSTIPDGMTEAAARETVTRFMEHGRESMTGTCFGCGLCTPTYCEACERHCYAPCPHCGGNDLIPVVYQYKREKPAWYDDWPSRFRPPPGEM